MTSPSLPRQPLPASVASRVKMPTKLTRFGIPLALLVVTFGSTTAVGMRYMHNFRLGRGPIMDDSDMLPYLWVSRNLSHWTMGLPFAFTIIGILLAHEFGHYFACRACKVDATLPHMLPAPTLSGTFGAVIKLRSRVHSRAALLAIGASGPIAGFLVALATTWLGLRLSTYGAAGSSAVLRGVQSPWTMNALAGLLRAQAAAPQPDAAMLVPHPVLTASWIGLLITALNLIPAGQLDGGHIAYAVAPAFHRLTSRIVTVVLALLGVFCWIGWILWAAVLLTPAMRHPRVTDRTPLQPWQWTMAFACGFILLTAGTYAPFEGYGLLEVLRKLPGRMHGGW